MRPQFCKNPLCFVVVAESTTKGAETKVLKVKLIIWLVVPFAFQCIIMLWSLP